MKYLVITLILFLFLNTYSIAQITPQESTVGFQMNGQENHIIDSLVEVAFQNSYYLQTLHEERSIRQTKVWQEKNSWLSSFRFGVQLFSVTNDYQSEISNTALLPSMGVNLQISPDKIITLPSRVRIAKSNVRTSENDILRQQKILRSWVEQKYLDYLQALEVVRLRKERLQAQLEMAVLIKEKFKIGEAKLDEVIQTQGGIEQMEEGLIRSQFAAEKIFREINVMIGEEKASF
ncbi:TolC family protein [Flammeovirgaceae bacterium SG7u.111]|nr:TolC family protein [Flammeovirgaceae bacterium SG7u.132]WPO34554.1 TolC family protein [Flammeovirgaceae bacterium SG7u.111]